MGWPGPRACTTAAVSLAFMLERADERLLSAVYTPLGQALHASPAQLGTLTMWRALVQVAHVACQPPSAVLPQSVLTECSSPCQDSVIYSRNCVECLCPHTCSPCSEQTDPTAYARGATTPELTGTSTGACVAAVGLPGRRVQPRAHHVRRHRALGRHDRRDRRLADAARGARPACRSCLPTSPLLTLPDEQACQCPLWLCFSQPRRLAPAVRARAPAHLAGLRSHRAALPLLAPRAVSPCPRVDAQATAWAAVNGAGLALVLPCCQSLVADYFRPEARGSGFACLFTASAIGARPGHAITAMITLPYPTQAGGARQRLRLPVHRVRHRRASWACSNPIPNALYPATTAARDSPTGCGAWATAAVARAVLRRALQGVQVQPCLARCARGCYACACAEASHMTGRRRGREHGGRFLCDRGQRLTPPRARGAAPPWQHAPPPPTPGAGGAAPPWQHAPSWQHARDVC
jgi:hypothetical protein